MIKETNQFSIPTKKSIRIVLIYFVFSALWILGSDSLMLSLVSEPSIIKQISIIKGWIFVLVTSLIIYSLISRALHSIFMQKSKLELADAELKNIFESASDGIFIASHKGEYINANAAALQMTGYSREELLNLSISQIVQNDPNASSLQLHLNKIKEGKKLITERTLRRKDGSTFIAEISGSILPNGDLIGIVRDISVRKKNEEALIQAEKNKSEILERITDGFVALDVNWNYTYLNNKAALLLNREKPEDLIGKNIWEEFPEGIGQTFYHNYFKAMETQQTIIMEEHYEPWNRWFENRIYPSKEGLSVYFSEITERKIAEIAIKEQERLLFETGKLAKVGGWEFDPVTLKGTWTPEVARIHDLNPDDETNVDIGLSFYEDESKLRIEAAVKKAIELGEPYDLELEMITAKGQKKWVRTIGKPVIDNGHVVNVRGSMQDITDLVIAKETAVKNEQLFHKLLENTPVPVAVTDAENNIQYINKKFIDLFGYSHEEIPMIDDFMVRAYPDETYRQKILDIWRNGKEYVRKHQTAMKPEEIKVVCKNGDVKDIEVGLVTISDLELSVFLDITDRKKIEMELRESEERYRKLVEIAPDAIAIHSNGIIVFANSTAAKLMRARSTDELIGVSISQIIHPDNWESSKERIKKLINGEKNLYPNNDKYIRLDGTTMDVEVTASPIFYKNSQSFIVIVRDISERLQSEIENRRRIEKLNAFFNSTIVGTINGNIFGDLYEANDEYLRITGYTREDFENGLLKWDKITPNNWLEVDKIAIAEAKKNGACLPYEKQYVRKDGSLIWVMVGFVLLGGERDESLAFILDISTIKEKEELLLKAEKDLRGLAGHLQSVREEERKSIARELHDEFGQVLTSIKMNLSLMKYEIEANSGSQVEANLISEINSMSEMIDNSVKRIKKIITLLRPELLDKLGLIPAIEWYVDEFTKETGIKCTLENKIDKLELDHDKEVAVFRITQESLTNVAKHSNAKKASITFRKETEYLILEITDDGCGINQTEKNNDPAFGIMGMTERAKLLGGVLEIKSGVNAGTTVRLIINS